MDASYKKPSVGDSICIAKVIWLVKMSSCDSPSIELAIYKFNVLGES